jgi:ABC-2 type transport system permease protein
MLWILFLKECKQMLKCLTYYVVLLCIILMYTTQLGTEKIINKPVAGQQDYGYAPSEDVTVIMNSTIMLLAREYQYNTYATYPIGFYKEVTLSKAKQEEIGDVLSAVTGIDRDKIDTRIKDYLEDKYFVSSNGDEVTYNVTTEGEVESPEVDDSEIRLEVAPRLTYEHFTILMAKVNKLLGGGSSYAKDKLQGNAYVPQTYEQALEQYNEIIEKDLLTGAYARLFCDYLGIVLAILPIFLAVTRGLRDRRARAEEIIYSRKASSLQIVMSRYFAMVIMLLIPVLMLGVFTEIGFISSGLKEGITVDYFAYPKYILAWLLPTIMITTSVGVFLTELTDTAIAIIVQGFWWFISLLTGRLFGNCGWNLIPRHNRTGYYGVFREYLGQFVMNRITYTVVALLILIASVLIYEMKRKGRLNLRGKIFSNRKVKSKA